jgi:recombination protein RecA
MSKKDETGLFGNKRLSDDFVSSLYGDIADESKSEVMLASGDGLEVSVRGVVSSQCETLDDAIGRGGYPLGRLTILHGSEGCGKTTGALHAVAEVQKMGGIAAYLDKEYKLDLEYADKIGVDRKSLFLCQPNTLEQAFEVIEVLIKHAAKLRDKLKRRIPVVVVLDSMNAAITKAQYDGDFGDQHYAPQARCFSQNFPKLIPKVYKEDVALIFISQVRKKIGVLFGNDEEIAGGKAPKFYSSLIVHFKRIGSLKKGSDIVGNRVIALVQKNQIAPPFKKAEFSIKFGEGIDYERSVIDFALAKQVIDKSGSWLSFESERLGLGVEASTKLLRDNPDLLKKILKEARGK